MKREIEKYSMSTDRKVDYYKEDCSTLIMNEFQYNTIKKFQSFFFLVELESSVLKLLWMEKQTQIAKTVLKKNL